MSAFDWAAFGAIVSLVTLPFVVATLAVSWFLLKQSKDDAQVRKATLQAAELTTKAANATRQATEEALEHTKIDNHRAYLWGVFECIQEWEVLLTGYRFDTDGNRALMLAARMSSYLDRLDEPLSRCRHLATADFRELWEDFNGTVGIMKDARAELREALMLRI